MTMALFNPAIVIVVPMVYLGSTSAGEAAPGPILDAVWGGLLHAGRGKVRLLGAAERLQALEEPISGGPRGQISI